MCKEKPLISVIVPIYNVKEYISQCSRSICSQTYQKLEIIFVDDGSTDGSYEVCKQIAEEDTRIVLIHKENGGLVSARKAGLAHASGEYVTFVDGDDWIDENTYEQIIEKSCSYNPDVIAYGCVEEYGFYRIEKTNAAEAGFYYGEKLKQLKEHIIMGENFFEWAVLPHLCDKLIRKSLLFECIGNIPDHISFAEDAVCSFPCMLKAQSVLMLDLVPYHYRQRTGSIVRSHAEMSEECFRDIYYILLRAFSETRTRKIQLNDYMFFLFCLKGYSKINLKTSLFPFWRVKPGERLLVYGAGVFGTVVKRYIETSDVFQLSGWTDKRADSYILQGIKLNPYESVITLQYDRLVISILNEKIGRDVRQELIGMGIAEEKIDFVSREVIERACLPHWLIESEHMNEKPYETNFR